MLTHSPHPLMRHEVVLDGMVRCFCTTEVVPTPHGEIVALRVAGDIDAATLSVLHGGLTEAFARYPAHVVVDISEVSFCTIRGLVVLAEAQHIADAHATTYAVSGVSSWAERLWPMLLPLDDLPRRYRTAAAGISAALDGASRTGR